MNNSIVPASTAIQTFRDAGYKNTASALAELIDNSIEANAKNIQILTRESEVQAAKRVTTRISDIMIYDDGDGMSADTLGICLQFGNGTRLESRKGIGRFGIGLPNASVSQCRRVEVYSWQNNSCHHTYLDVDEVKDNQQQVVNIVKECKMPFELLKDIEGEVGQSGSLIVWKKCDRLDIARASTLFKRMESELCRVYRHFLDTDDTYGKQRKIKLINTGKERSVTDLHANDPLYLMVPNTVPGFKDKATNILHGNVISLMLPYNEEGDKAEVQLRFSVALPETQKLGGGSDLGRHYRSNTGISFVRAAREIDFGTFGYFNPQDERHRWWGCEVRFEPIFDEVFGVTNNKQAVRGIHFIDMKEFKSDHDDWELMIKEDPKLALRQELSKRISIEIKTLEEIIKSRGKGTRSSEKSSLPDKPSRIANKELENNKKDTKSKLEGEAKTKEQIQQEWVSSVMDSDTSLTEEEAKEIANNKIDLIVEKSFSSWPGAQFFAVETTGMTCNLVINRKHPFYTEMYEPLMSNDEHRYIDALDLLMMGYARTQDELFERIDDIDEINNTWGSHVKSFLKQLNADA